MKVRERAPGDLLARLLGAPRQFGLLLLAERLRLLERLCWIYGCLRDRRGRSGLLLLRLLCMRRLRYQDRQTEHGDRDCEPYESVLYFFHSTTRTSPFPQTVCRPTPTQRAARSQGRNSVRSP